MSTFQLPIIDLSKSKTNRDELSKQIIEALENVGFLYIDNVEGIDFEKMFRCCKWFFNQPIEKKRKIMRNFWNPDSKNIYRGYFPVVEGEPSRKEGFEFGRDVSIDNKSINPENWFYERTPWPEEDGTFPFKEFMQAQYEVVHSAAMEILRLTANGLGVEETAFIHLFQENPCSTFRIMHYPPWDGPPPKNARIEDGKIITTPDHSDSNFLTLLCLFNYEGLEVVGPDGNWIPVAPRENSFVMNIGDLFSRMMNGRFKATRHRVLDIGIDRYSVPFFLEPAYESDIGVNYMSQYIKGGPEHVPEKYGHYMVNMVKYVRKYFEYKVLPDFENVKEKYYGKGQKDI